MSKNLITSLLLLISTSMIAQKTPNRYLFVGSYSEAKDEAIHIYNFDIASGQFQKISAVKDIGNPTFLALAPNKKYVYAVSEIGNKGMVVAYKFDGNSGELRVINKVSAQGDHPCHIAVHKTGKYLTVGNYSGGNLAHYKLNIDGSIQDNPQVINHIGKSVHPDRQTKPYVHSVNWQKDGKDLFVADLGTDKISKYTLGADGLLQLPAIETNLKPGSGPRHFTIHPSQKWAYAIMELSNEIEVYDLTNGKLSSKQIIKTLPDTFTQTSYTADIHISPDGKFLYGSNRGHNSLTIYSISPTTGQLQLVDHQPVGNWPRNFVIDPLGNYLLAANQNSNNIIIFKRDKLTGKLTKLPNEIKVAKPVCLKFLQ